MGKIKHLVCYQDEDRYGNVIAQVLKEPLPNGTEKVIYFVFNSEPEDAIIGRDLMGADDVIDIMTKALQWGAEGYTSIDIQYVHDIEEDQ